MDVKDYTYINRMKQFVIMFTSISLGLFIIRLWKADFDVDKLIIDYTEFFIPFLVGLSAAIFVNKVKYVIKNITNIDELIKWLIEYFKNNNGKIIYNENNIILVKVTNKVRRIFRRTEETYYEVKIDGNKAVIMGPLYQEPKFIIRDEQSTVNNV